MSREPYDVDESQAQAMWEVAKQLERIADAVEPLIREWMTPRVVTSLEEIPRWRFWWWRRMWNR